MLNISLFSLTLAFALVSWLYMTLALRFQPWPWNIFVIYMALTMASFAGDTTVIRKLRWSIHVSIAVFGVACVGCTFLLDINGMWQATHQFSSVSVTLSSLSLKRWTLCCVDWQDSLSTQRCSRYSSKMKLQKFHSGHTSTTTRKRWQY